jgi:hypothetical protein
MDQKCLQAARAYKSAIGHFAGALLRTWWVTRATGQDLANANDRQWLVVIDHVRNRAWNPASRID